MQEVMDMTTEQDYKTAYEALSRALAEAAQILAAARIRTLAGLCMRDGKELDEADQELMDLIAQMCRDE